MGGIVSPRVAAFLITLKKLINHQTSVTNKQDLIDLKGRASIPFKVRSPFYFAETPKEYQL